MSEQRDTSADVSRLFVPEREFWIPEIADQYLDDDGRPKQTRSGENDFQKIPVPLIDPENYPVVDIPALAENLRSMFKPGYRFPRHYVKTMSDEHGQEREAILYNRDNVDHVQSQHLYQPKAHGGDTSLMHFCNDPERKWRLPWIGHNVKQSFSMIQRYLMDGYAHHTYWRCICVQMDYEVLQTPSGQTQECACV